MTTTELTALINTVWDAVSKSKAGPIDIAMPDGKPGIKETGWRTFLAVLPVLIVRDQTVAVSEPKEPWQGD